MNYSVGVEYALHTLIYLVDLEHNQTIGIKALAAIHDISPTYLSKIYTKLKKQQILISTSGVNGGYSLAKDAQDISFYEIINAIEGESMFFQCLEIRKHNSVSKPDIYTSPCLIKKIMDEAQQPMIDYLKNQSLRFLYDQAMASFSPTKKDDIKEWIKINAH